MFTQNACPVCGAQGKLMELQNKGKSTDDTKNCGACGTVYNGFGVILTTDSEHKGLELN